MKIFVCEFISSGGLYREDLTDGLLREGLMMRDALLVDLVEIEDVEVLCAYDHRLAAPVVQHAVVVNAQDDVWQTWEGLIAGADAVWLIAPESSGILLRLTELVAKHGKLLLGCPSSAVRLAASKLTTIRALTRAGIDCVPTCSTQEWLAGTRFSGEGGWVIKPDDGVSCEGSIHLHDDMEVDEWLMQNRQLTYIVQPWRPGLAASLSMLCRDGRAWLLSCNRQMVLPDAGRFYFQGSVINGLSQYWNLFERLAQQTAQAAPNLAGYIGVDLMLGIDDPLVLEVLEINPRLTTSYAGLRQATGVNVTALILTLLGKNALKHPQFSLPQISRNIVDITLK